MDFSLVYSLSMTKVRKKKAALNNFFNTLCHILSTFVVTYENYLLIYLLI